ncbi:MAG: dihydrofolate reductase [Bacteroidetes bacterium]|nr:dihydrofolate reductase [Bacteroidota bacterium]
MIKTTKHLLILLMATLAVFSCDNAQKADANAAENDLEKEEMETTIERDYWAEDFADIRMHRYYVESWDKLNLKQKELLYYLHKAALAGRDIFYDQNYKHNLKLRKVIENIIANYTGDRESENWKAFHTFAKQFWVANGIHHHYGMEKFTPGFDAEYFKELVANSPSEWPISQEYNEETFWALINKIIFDPEFDKKKTNKDKGIDKVAQSAVNFYEGVTEKEVVDFYKKMRDPNDKTPIWYGLNSKVVKEGNKLVEKVWKVDGMYSGAIKEVVKWIEKAAEVAENDKQQKAFQLLAEYYKTGDLKTWDKYNIAWVEATEGDIDVINGFIEVYDDPLGKKASFESVVQIADLEASEQMAVVADQAQWFEDNSPILDQHKKKEVKGISYKVIEVVTEGGACNPTGPIGINLPNSNWIRETKGSKSVSLHNIVLAYEKAAGKGTLTEFAHDEEEIERAEKYGVLASKLHTALHEVVGHASGKIEEGVQDHKETLLNYASTLEEARADLVALYYLMDPKLVELGLMPSLEVGKAEYDSYIRNGLMMQLKRLDMGKTIEEDHMRNRQMVAAWVFEKGQAENVITKVLRDDKFYFEINDYEKLRVLFGDLLREVQRIKSQGDFDAGSALVEDYGVQVDANMHQQVLNRVASLNIPPYGAFINPRLELETNDAGEITDVTITYPEDFTEQMMRYGKNYSFLPLEN